MKQIFEKQKQLVIDEVRRMTDYKLESTNNQDYLLNKCRILKLELFVEKEVTQPEKIPYVKYMRLKNIGGHYKQDSTAEIVSIARIVHGDNDVIRFLIQTNQLPKSNLCGFDIKNNTCKAIFLGVEPTIHGNQTAQEKIRKDSNDFFHTVERSFKEVNAVIESFNENELKDFISQVLKLEIERRRATKATMDFLAS